MSDQINEGAPVPEEVPAEQPAAEPTPAAAEPTPAAEPIGPTPGEAWESVLSALGELGDALSTWAKAAADTPENRQHLAEGATQVGQAIGGTAQEFSQAAAPHVASAFAGLADAFGRAAQKVSEATTGQPAAEPPTRPAPEPPAGDSAAVAAEPASGEPTSANPAGAADAGDAGDAGE